MKEDKIPETTVRMLETIVLYLSTGQNKEFERLQNCVYDAYELGKRDALEGGAK